MVQDSYDVDTLFCNLSETPIPTPTTFTQFLETVVGVGVREITQKWHIQSRGHLGVVSGVPMRDNVPPINCGGVKRRTTKDLPGVIKTYARQSLNSTILSYHFRLPSCFRLQREKKYTGESTCSMQVSWGFRVRSRVCRRS